VRQNNRTTETASLVSVAISAPPSELVRPVVAVFFRKDGTVEAGWVEGALERALYRKSYAAHDKIVDRMMAKHDCAAIERAYDRANGAVRTRLGAGMPQRSWKTQRRTSWHRLPPPKHAVTGCDMERYMSS
jgi:hypothetical protein